MASNTIILDTLCQNYQTDDANTAIKVGKVLRIAEGSTVLDDWLNSNQAISVISMKSMRVTLEVTNEC